MLGLLNIVVNMGSIPIFSTTVATKWFSGRTQNLKLCNAGSIPALAVTQIAT